MLILIGVLLFSVVVHEVAHAWQAYREGDYTAARLGRITLNPIPHLDAVGSFLVPLALHLSNAGFVFGWAKPVPVVPSRFREPAKGDIRVSLAGVASNFALALAFAALLGLANWAYVAFGTLGGATLVLGAIFEAGIFINLLLAFFNLIPVPPLDGSRVFAYLLPEPWRRAYQGRAGSFGVIVLVAILWLVPGASGVLLAPCFLVFDRLLDFARLWG